MGYLGNGPGVIYMPPPGKSLDYSQLNDATTAALIAYRNRAINGAFTLAQRAASFTGSPNGYQTVDRFGCSVASGSGHTIGQVADGPIGTRYCFGVTIGTGAAPAAANFNGLWHNIEGYNVADLGYGTSWAKVAVLSFAVKSSIPGNYAVSFMNGSLNRHYLMPYTVNAANTWEPKSIVLTGDTAGTWDSSNGNGLSICWDLGTGSNYEDVLGGWTAGQKYSTSASVKLAATSGAIFRVTNVQFEAGAIVTPFEVRPVGIEGVLCQRYYMRWNGTGGFRYCMAYAFSTTQAEGMVLTPAMRAVPTCSYSSSADFSVQNAVATALGVTAVSAFPNVGYVLLRATTSGGLVAGNASEIIANGATGWLDASAEL